MPDLKDNLRPVEDCKVLADILSGPIPPALAGMHSLSVLDTQGTDFTGCIAPELPETWVEATG